MWKSRLLQRFQEAEKHEDDAAVSGDRLVFVTPERLFRDHAKVLASFVRKLGVPADEVRDVVQKVFLRVVALGGCSEAGGSPRAWLFAIAYGIVRNDGRARLRRRVDLDEESVMRAETASPSPEAAIANKQAITRIEAALDTLDEKYRVVFVMFELELLSVEDISRSLEIPSTTVHGRLYTARRKIRELYLKLEGKAP